MNPSQRRARKDRNKSRRQRAEGEFLLRWPNKNAMLTPLKAPRYTGNARRYRLRKECRKVSENFPKLISEAVLSSLVDYHNARMSEEPDNPEPKLAPFPEMLWPDTGKPKSEIDLGILLLKRLHRLSIVQSKERQALFAPLLAIQHALEDVREGVRSKYTEHLFVSKGRGKPNDPKVIAGYKCAIGTAYLVLLTMGFCSHAKAVRRIKSALRQLGMKTLSSLEKYENKSNPNVYRILSRTLINALLVSLAQEITYFKINYRPLRNIFNSTGSEDLKHEWKSVVNWIETSASLTRLERYKASRIWILHLDLVVSLSLQIFSDLEAVKRFRAYA